MKGAAVKRSRIIGERLASQVARAVVLAAVLGLAGSGSAAAAPVPVGNAAFARAGVEVYPEGAVGLGCQTFGLCAGAAADLAGSARPQYLSTRPGEAVEVACRLADLAKVVGFFGGGDDVVAGWATANGLHMRGPGRVPACGLLD